MSTTDACDLWKSLSENEGWLRTAIHSRLGKRDEVEEVMQEVALATAQQLAKDVAVDRPGPWLYRVAIRQVMLFRRKAGRHRKLVRSVQRLLGPTPQVSEGPDTDPLRFLLSSERQQGVRRALAALGELDRQLVMLKYVEGLSYLQIAERLGVSPSAVQSRLHRARAALRQQLEQDRPESVDGFG